MLSKNISYSKISKIGKQSKFSKKKKKKKKKTPIPVFFWKINRTKTIISGMINDPET